MSTAAAGRRPWLLALNAGSSTLKLAWAELVPGGARLRGRSAAESHGRGPAALFEPCLRQLGAPAGPPAAAVHRVVHGADALRAPLELDAAAERRLREWVPLAPLHLPPALELLGAARRQFPGAPQLAVFDTAFHSGRAPESELYALPPELAPEIRRYGFHGLAHRSLLESLAAELGCPPDSPPSAVTLQLGSGCSACAIDAGRSVETSMGFTPLEGLVMATRSGDLDPGALLHLLRRGLDADALEELLMRRSGLLGLGGSADVRELLTAERGGDERAAVALRLFARRIALLAGSYWTLLGGRGALVFGGGIGANSAELRARIAAALGAWNVRLDPERNDAGARGAISAPGSRAVCVFDTDEEAILATEAARWLAGAAPS